MDLLHERCAGLDVHQATVVACARWVTGRRVRRETRELLALADWLRTHAVAHVVMETDSDRFELRLHLDLMAQLEHAITEIDECVRQALAPCRAVVERLMTIPGDRPDHRAGAPGRDRPRHDAVPERRAQAPRGEPARAPPHPAPPFLPSFWLVVRGSLGLRSVTQMLSDHAAGLDRRVTVLFAMTSIALGTLVGAALYKALTEHFGWWRLQVGRAGSYVQRARRRKPQGGSKS